MDSVLFNKLTREKNLQLTTMEMYASPYWVVDEKCYSKHYYAGSDRVCSKIGGGISSYWYEEPLVGTNDSLYDKKKKQQYYLSRIAYKLGEYEPEFDCNGQGNPDIILNLELPKLDSINTYEPECYYYHTDHIGSTSWITDINGGWIQYCEYLPFGEPLVDQRSTTWNSRYTFSGKERDGETGYSYFGARYYNSDISIWLSVDPLSDKYPNLTPYAYCANNPIKLVDPNGEEIYEFEENGKYIGIRDGSKGSPDQIVIKKADGNCIESKEFANGTIKEDYTTNVSQRNGESVTVTFLKITGDQNAKEIFEFAVDNTTVEWGVTSVGSVSGDGGVNILANSQEKKHEGSGNDAINRYASTGIRGYTHNHRESACPSAPDLYSAKIIHKEFPNAILSIYNKEVGHLPYNSGGIILESDRDKALKYSMSKIRLPKIP